jgi:anti-sigma factor RsiW
MNKFTCDDKATLVSYLYGEVDAAARQAIDDHLAQCAACADELMALGDVRSELGLWAPPDVELDFQIVSKSKPPASNVLRPARWWNTVPGWAQAAAAILVLAAGLSIANLQIKSGPDGLSVSTGWMPVATVAAPMTTANDDAWKTALVSLEQQLRSEIRTSREAGATRAAAPGAVDEATIRRVQQLIADAEQRHERELAARFVDFTRDLTMQRRADMMNITRFVGQYDEQLSRQQKILYDQGRALNNVIRVSSSPQQ